MTCRTAAKGERVEGSAILVMFCVLLVAVGLGFYALHLKRKVARDAQAAARAAAGSGTAKQRASRNSYAICRQRQRRHPAQNAGKRPHAGRAQRACPGGVADAAGAISQDRSTHPIGKGSDVRQVFLMDDGTAIVDTSSAFADSHPSGVLAEELTVASVVSDAERERQQDHAGEDSGQRAGARNPRRSRRLKRFYEASNIGQVVKDMQ